MRAGIQKNIYTEQNLYCPFSYITQFVTTFMLKKSYFIVLKYFMFYPMVCRIINLLNFTYKRKILVSRSYIYFNWTLHSTFYHFYSRLQEQLHGKHIMWKHSTFYRNVLFLFSLFMFAWISQRSLSQQIFWIASYMLVQIS